MAAAGNIVSILQSLQSINNDERGAAELQLKQIEEQHRQSYWHALAKVISSSDTPPSVRQQAGLALKNALNPTVADAQVNSDQLSQTLLGQAIYVLLKSRCTRAEDCGC